MRLYRQNFLLQTDKSTNVPVNLQSVKKLQAAGHYTNYFNGTVYVSGSQIVWISRGKARLIGHLNYETKRHDLEAQKCAKITVRRKPWFWGLFDSIKTHDERKVYFLCNNNVNYFV